MAHVQENLTGVRVVRAFGRERFEIDRFDEKNDQIYRQVGLSLGGTLGVFWGLGDIVSSGEMLVMTIVGSLLAVSGRITLGEFLVFLSYTTTLMWPIRQLGHILSEMSKTSVSLGRIMDILDTPVEADEPEATKASPLDRDIVFIPRPNFGYGGQPVLKDLSFTVKSGATFGILGATGFRKSTITYLLNRLYELPEDGGRITIGGVDIRRIDRHYLRRGVGLVLAGAVFVFQVALSGTLTSPPGARTWGSCEKTRRSRPWIRASCRSLTRLRNARRRAGRHAVGRTEAARGHCPQRL